MIRRQPNRQRDGRITGLHQLKPARGSSYIRFQQAFMTAALTFVDIGASLASVQDQSREFQPWYPLAAMSRAAELPIQRSDRRSASRIDSCARAT